MVLKWFVLEKEDKTTTLQVFRAFYFFITTLFLATAIKYIIHIQMIEYLIDFIITVFFIILYIFNKKINKKRKEMNTEAK